MAVKTGSRGKKFVSKIMKNNSEKKIGSNVCKNYTHIDEDTSEEVATHIMRYLFFGRVPGASAGCCSYFFYSAAGTILAGYLLCGKKPAPSFSNNKEEIL